MAKVSESKYYPWVVGAIAGVAWVLVVVPPWQWIR